MGIFATALAASLSTVVVETSSPDVHCPDVHTTRKAVGERLSTLTVEANGTWRAVYGPSAGKQGSIDLSLYDPSGNQRLARRLEIAGESCATMVQVIVVILERYFRDLGVLPPTSVAASGPAPATSPPTGGPAPTTTAPAGTPTPPKGAMEPANTANTTPPKTDPRSSRPRAAEPPSGRADAPPPASAGSAASPGADTSVPTTAAQRSGQGRSSTDPRRFRRWTSAWSVGAGFTTPPSGLGLTFDARLWLTSHVHVGLAGAWSPTRMEQPVGPAGGGGRVEAQAVPLRLWAGIGHDFGWSYLYAGPSFLVSIERGESRGIAEPDNGFRPVLGPGLAAGAMIWLWRPVALTVHGGVEATLPLRASQFVVSNEEVLRQPWVTGLISASMTFVWSP